MHDPARPAAPVVAEAAATPTLMSAAALSPTIAYMQRRWGGLLQHDPCYNPNLSLDDADWRLASPPRIGKLAIG